MMSLTDIQQAFVRRYMNGNECVNGVRIHEIEGENVILVEVMDRASVELPPEFFGLRVEVREGDRAVLAYR
ncbi:MAG TPA: hypothetical protein VMB05_08260 [Solirubrobacteraceae bacterium]|nr:hypothetical protein [Solirubrobacteraceae bacterium]